MTTTKGIYMYIYIDINNFVCCPVEVELEGVNHKIVAPGLPATYQITQFHFHWGSIDDQGSEHSRNEKHFPMEV